MLAEAADFEDCRVTQVLCRLSPTGAARRRRRGVIVLTSAAHGRDHSAEAGSRAATAGDRRLGMTSGVSRTRSSFMIASSSGTDRRSRRSSRPRAVRGLLQPPDGNSGRRVPGRLEQVREPAVNTVRTIRVKSQASRGRQGLFHDAMRGQSAAQLQRRDSCDARVVSRAWQRPVRLWGDGIDKGAALLVDERESDLAGGEETPADGARNRAPGRQMPAASRRPPG
jgi:hypothetical protein